MFYLYKHCVKLFLCADLWGKDTLSGETILTKYICNTSEKESNLKGKNLLPMGANSFLLE